MMKSMTLKEIRATAARLGLRVEESAPGDGTRRFKFYYQDGHAASGLLGGARWATVWLDGFEQRERKSNPALPSSHIGASKARKILHEGIVRGHRLTERQRRMFGAASRNPPDIPDDPFKDYPGDPWDLHRGPGRFQGEPIMTEILWLRSMEGGPDEELGDGSEGFGWYGRMDSIVNGDPVSAILHVDSNGFVWATYFDSEKELDDEWNALTNEYEKWLEDDEGLEIGRDE